MITVFVFDRRKGIVEEVQVDEIKDGKAIIKRKTNATSTYSVNTKTFTNWTHTRERAIILCKMLMDMEIKLRQDSLNEFIKLRDNVG